MRIRRAKEKDMLGIEKLLMQVLSVHHKSRPDLFRPEGTKYTKEELADIIHDDKRPVFVAFDEKEQMLGYIFCIFEEFKNHNIRMDNKELYIDDLCVDESIRGQHVGKKLYEHVLEFARDNDCSSVTLNVWSGNQGAEEFYRNCGLIPRKIGMELML